MRSDNLMRCGQVDWVGVALLLLQRALLRGMDLGGFCRGYRYAYDHPNLAIGLQPAQAMHIWLRHSVSVSVSLQSLEGQGITDVLCILPLLIAIRLVGSRCQGKAISTSGVPRMLFACHPSSSLGCRSTLDFHGAFRHHNFRPQKGVRWSTTSKRLGHMVTYC